MFALMVLLVAVSTCVLAQQLPMDEANALQIVLDGLRESLFEEHKLQTPVLTFCRLQVHAIPNMQS